MGDGPSEHSTLSAALAAVNSGDTLYLRKHFTSTTSTSVSLHTMAQGTPSYPIRIIPDMEEFDQICGTLSWNLTDSVTFTFDLPYWELVIPQNSATKLRIRSLGGGATLLFEAEGTGIDGLVVETLSDPPIPISVVFSAGSNHLVVRTQLSSFRCEGTAVVLVEESVFAQGVSLGGQCLLSVFYSSFWRGTVTDSNGGMATGDDSGPLFLCDGCFFDFGGDDFGGYLSPMFQFLGRDSMIVNSVFLIDCVDFFESMIQVQSGPIPVTLTFQNNYVHISSEVFEVQFGFFRIEILKPSQKVTLRLLNNVFDIETTAVAPFVQFFSGSPVAIPHVDCVTLHNNLFVEDKPAVVISVDASGPNPCGLDDTSSVSNTPYQIEGDGILPFPYFSPMSIYSGTYLPGESPERDGRGQKRDFAAFEKGPFLAGCTCPSYGHSCSLFDGDTDCPHHSLFGYGRCGVDDSERCKRSNPDNGECWVFEGEDFDQPPNPSNPKSSWEVILAASLPTSVFLLMALAVGASIAVILVICAIKKNRGRSELPAAEELRPMPAYFGNGIISDTPNCAAARLHWEFLTSESSLNIEDFSSSFFVTCWCSHCRGGPSENEGWVRFGLKRQVVDELRGVYDSWHRAFRGTTIEQAEKVVRDNCRFSSDRIIVSSSLEHTTEEFSESRVFKAPGELNPKLWQVSLEVQVAPSEVGAGVLADARERIIEDFTIEHRGVVVASALWTHDTFIEEI